MASRVNSGVNSDLNGVQVLRRSGRGRKPKLNENCVYNSPVSRRPRRKNAAGSSTEPRVQQPRPTGTRPRQQMQRTRGNAMQYESSDTESNYSEDYDTSDT